MLLSVNNLPRFISVDIFDPYVPPHLQDLLTRTKEWGKEKVQTRLSSKTKKSLKAITEKAKTFQQETFGEEALGIYKAAHNALNNRDEERLHELVTEYAFTVRTWILFLFDLYFILSIS